MLHGKSLQPFGSHVKEIDFRTFDLFHMISRTEFAELWLQALFFGGDPFPELRHVLLASIPVEAIFLVVPMGYYPALNARSRLI